METWFWVVGWFLSILTITGNGFIIFLVCSRPQLRTKTNAFVVSLTMADFCVGMSVFPSLYFCDGASVCNWPKAWLSWVNMIRWLFGYASVTNLCNLVLDRYIAVVKPLRYLTFMTRRRVIQMISLSWAIATVLQIFPVASLLFSAPLFNSIGQWMTVIITEFLACLMVVFCFANMVHVVYKHDRSARTLAKQLRFNHRVLRNGNDKSAVVMMAIVVGLFLICYGIYLRCTIEIIFNDQESCNDTEYKIPILVLNSAVNPLAYAFFKKDLKKQIQRLIYTVIPKKRNKVKTSNVENHVALVSSTL